MSIFQFKEFTLKQTDSAAKLTTDATIFGASLPFSENVSAALEVGTGTGILSLMLSQRGRFAIDAVEIEERAYNEASLNFQRSPWANRLQAHHVDFNLFYAAAKNKNKYDLVFSNPPFFTKNLQSPVTREKNTAYHTNTLSFKELATGISLVLKDSGEAFIMLPAYEMTLFVDEIKMQGFSISHILKIHHSLNKPALRIIHGFSKHETEKPAEKVIYIRDENNEFHPGYIELLKPFLTIF
ncbi:tRNA1(Val) (adenine(37)-N6)-methyltransferase [Marivirga lumbricoides]|uniref:tRNA1(Val) (adenine(37)-N6)-methyltransferase n=1 Tax=Marivirga lumbricoides TaxID=1046115 RepID=A0ABQ1LS48_9BACT|nr:tRNA1(Val) (adenine(37)-N6)-methyltransferase [Marivirga lumbricoides]